MTLLNILNDFLAESAKQDIQQTRAAIDRTVQEEQRLILNNPFLSAYEKEWYLRKVNQIRSVLHEQQNKREILLKISEFCNELSKFGEKMNKK